MSKPYFTQLLPVEGDIQIGDIVQGESGYYYQVAEIDPMTVQARSIKAELINLSKCRKVKLFLCSRDIRLNDTYYNEAYYPYPNGDVADTNSKVIDANLMAGGDNDEHTSYKVIGEVSPDATWVKGLMEFDREDWSLEEHAFIWSEEQCCSDCKDKNWCVRKGCTKHPGVVRFRCPFSPNHFH